jgi:glycosyltransferase involved in cell wall biosynthesis
MKVLYLITRSDHGGGQVHLLDLMQHLPQGVTPVVASGDCGFLTDRAAELCIPVRIIPALRQPMAPLHDCAAVWQVMRLIRAERPDLVHAHTSKAGLVGRIAAAITGTPAVFTAHTWSFADGIIPSLQRIAVPLERFAAWLGGPILTVSRSNMQQGLRRKVGKPAQYSTVWNGIPDAPQRATPGTMKLFTILMAARFVPQKDQLTLIQAMAGVAGTWRLQFAGDGPERGACEAAARAAGIADRVEFLGARGDIPGLLANADLFVLSTHWEGLPLSILEAMRAGLPVIATQTGGVGEAVQDGVTGFLTAPGDLMDLRIRIQQLLSSRELVRQMGAAGRKRYERDFQISSMVQGTLAAYSRALTQQTSSEAAGDVLCRPVVPN